jgi:hypothetical protein
MCLGFKTSKHKRKGNEMTLLDNLCQVNGQQGGTIHQFFGRKDWTNMSIAHEVCVKLGVQFYTREHFDALAGKCGLTIKWQ